MLLSRQTSPQLSIKDSHRSWEFVLLSSLQGLSISKVTEVSPQAKATPGVFPTAALTPPLSLQAAPGNTELTRTLICLWMMSLVMLAFAIFLQWGRRREAVGRAAVHPSIPAEPGAAPRPFSYLHTAHEGTRAGTPHVRLIHVQGQALLPRNTGG